jgi:hypothetical protein
MTGIIQEVVVVEVKLRFKNETYDFYLTGILLLPPNFTSDHLRRAAHYIITQNAPPQMSVERAEIIAKIQCSQDYYDASFKTYYWHLLPSFNGFVSTLNPEKIPLYHVATFFIKGFPEHKAPIVPYILNTSFKLTEVF